MKSLRLSLRLLLEFSGPQHDFGVGELAERCSVSKGQVSKVLEAFADYGFLAQDPETRRYAVGVHSYTLGSRFLANDQLCRAAISVMRDLVARTGHSARLSVLNGDQVLYLFGLEGLCSWTPPGVPEPVCQFTPLPPAGCCWLSWIPSWRGNCCPQDPCARARRIPLPTAPR